jgi:hypothetical protein
LRQSGSARTPGGYTTAIPDDVDLFYVAVRARRDGKTGPVSTITIPAPEVPFNSPENQSARFDRE